MTDRPWSRLSADLFYTNLPLLYSLTLKREPPDTLRGSLRARRTLFEGLMIALAEKTGRRPSMAERASDTALDAAESVLTLGKPAFRAVLLAGLFVEKNAFERAEAARRVIEAGLRARGLTAQRLFYIAERALHHFQPGGQLFPGLDEPLLFLEETLPLMPALACQDVPTPPPSPALTGEGGGVAGARAPEKVSVWIRMGMAWPPAAVAPENPPLPMPCSSA